jgi:hypothetical protein
LSSLEFTLLLIDKQVALITGAHTTGGSYLGAQSIIDHHKVVLQNIAHPTSRIPVCDSMGN